MIAIYITILCIAALVLGFLLLLGLCTVAAAADAQMEELLRDGHEHY